MLVSFSKLFVILVLAQCVISVEFYKSKRVPLRYKERRRTYSLRNREQNVDSKPVEPFINKNQDKPIDDLQTSDDKQPHSTTSTIHPEEDTLDLLLLKNQEENILSKPVKTHIYGNGHQDEEFIDNGQTADDKQPISITSTIKPKRRPFNARPLRNKKEDVQRKPGETDVNKNSNEDSVIQTTNKNQPSLITSTIKPKRRPSNIRNLKNKGERAEAKSVETFLSGNANQDKISIENIQTTEEKRPSLTTTILKPKRRLFNRLLQRNKENKADNKPVESIVTENVDQVKVSMDYGRTIVEKTATLITSTIKPLRRTLSLFSLKKLEENGISKPTETILKEKTKQDKESITTIQTIGNKKPNVSTSIIKSITPSLKMNQENNKNKSVATKVGEDIEQGKLSVGNVQIIRDKKPSSSTSSTSVIVKPKTTTLENNRENSENKSVETIVSKTTEQNNTFSVNVQTIGDTVNPKTPPLNKKEENTDSKSFETIFSENTNQDTLPNSNVKTVEKNKIAITNSTFEPRRRKLNLRPLKNIGENSESKPVETFITKNENIKKVSISNVQTINDTLAVTTSTIIPLRPTLNTYSSKNKEENIDSRTDETLLKRNTNQDKASIGNTQSTRDRKLTIASTTIKPKRRTLNIVSLKIDEGNPNSQSVEMFVNKNSKQETESTDNVQVDKETAIKNPTSTSSTSVRPERQTFSSAKSELGISRIIKTHTKITVEKPPLDVESTSNIGKRTISNNSKIKSSQNFSEMKATVAQVSQSYKNYHQSTTPYTPLARTTQHHVTYIPIVGVENYVYAHSGDYHYSYEGGDGTKAFERSKLKPVGSNSNTPGVVGGFSYKDKDGNDYSLSYTAGEDGYRPVGAHLPTPPPIPPAIQRALRILATKTTPKPITESIISDY